jgi:hypothetical protein
VYTSIVEPTATTVPAAGTVEITVVDPGGP